MGTGRDEPWRSTFAALPRPLRITAAVSACLLLTAGALYLLGEVFTRLAPLAFAILAALLLTTLLSPLCDLLRRARFPAGLAAFITEIFFLGLLTLVVAVIWNRAARDFPDLRSALSTGIENARDYLVDGPLSLSERQVDDISATIVDALQASAPDPVGGATLAFEAIGAILLTIVLLFFFLKDGADIWRWLVTRFPTSARPQAQAAGTAGWTTLTRYLRGTAFVAAVDGVGIGVAVAVIGVPLALPIGVLTFVASFIPLLGATLAGAVAVVVALVTTGPVQALLVLAAVIAVQQLEGNLLEPLIMSRAVRLHPVAVLVTIAAGTLIGGIPGAAVSVPLVAVSYRVLRTLRGFSDQHRRDGPEPVAD